jgi:hypothetical protein
MAIGLRKWTHLSGYSPFGDLTDSVQEPPRFLQKKFSKKFAPAELSNKVTLFATRISRASWRFHSNAVG